MVLTCQDGDAPYRGMPGEHGLDLDDYQWYLDLRRYGTVPHSGFGIGIERLVTWVAGISHIRETIPFPRQIHRIRP